MFKIKINKFLQYVFFTFPLQVQAPPKEVVSQRAVSQAAQSEIVDSSTISALSAIMVGAKYILEQEEKDELYQKLLKDYEVLSDLLFISLSKMSDKEKYDIIQTILDKQANKTEKELELLIDMNNVELYKILIPMYDRNKEFLFNILRKLNDMTGLTRYFEASLTSLIESSKDGKVEDIKAAAAKASKDGRILDKIFDILNPEQCNALKNLLSLRLTGDNPQNTHSYLLTLRFLLLMNSKQLVSIYLEQLNPKSIQYIADTAVEWRTAPNCSTNLIPHIEYKVTSDKAKMVLEQIWQKINAAERNNDNTNDEDYTYKTDTAEEWDRFTAPSKMLDDEESNPTHKVSEEDNKTGDTSQPDKS